MIQILEYWWVPPWLALAWVAFRYLGWRAAAAVLLPGLGYYLFMRGRNSANAERQRRDAEMKRRLDDEYRKIDDRGADRDDVIDRLSGGKF